jgi:hypothetical protein
MLPLTSGDTMKNREEMQDLDGWCSVGEGRSVGVAQRIFVEVWLVLPAKMALSLG